MQLYSNQALLYPNLRNQPVQPDTGVFQHLITHSICQLQIAGCNGSYACTVTTTLAEECDLVNSVLLAGNSGYDRTGQNGLLTVDKVLSVQHSIGMDNASELLMHLVQTDAVLVLFADTAAVLVLFPDTAGKNRSAGVLVASPYSFTLVCDSLSSSLVVFDGHVYEYSLHTSQLLMAMMLSSHWYERL